MFYIALPFADTQRLSFYLAMEEFLARHTDIDECFFMWQVKPTVIFGRNQLIENEVNMDYCREHGIQTYRRKSGGGCVYADMNNIMFSYINSGENVTMTFDKYINMVVEVLKQLGLEAYTSGRNDILIDGKKVKRKRFLSHARPQHRSRHYALRYALAEHDWQHHAKRRKIGL